MLSPKRIIGTPASGQDYQWSNPTIWGGQVPEANDVVVIGAGQQVILDESVNVQGVIVAGDLVVADNTGVSLTSDYVLATYNFGLKGAPQGSEVYYTLSNLPSSTQVTAGATEVSSRVALDATTTTSYLRLDNGLLFKLVSDRKVYLAPNTDNAYMQQRDYGTVDIRISTGVTDYSSAVVADFEAGVDSRASTAAFSAIISPVLSGWEDQPDAINWWDVTTNGDGQWGFGDFHLRVNQTNWLGYDGLSLNTIFGGMKAGYQLFLHDKDDGYVYLGRQSEGRARIDLSQIEPKYLDQVDDVLIRVLEQDLTTDANQAGQMQRIHLKSIDLHKGEQIPIADFENGVDPRGSTAAMNATIGSVNSSPDFQGEGINWWDVTTNGDGIWGFGDFHLRLSSTEDWRNLNWLTVNAILGGGATKYELLIHDKEDSFTSLGRFSSGEARIDLSSVADRYLDKVDDIIVRVLEAGMTNDPWDLNEFFTRVHFKSIYLE